MNWKKELTFFSKYNTYTFLHLYISTIMKLLDHVGGWVGLFRVLLGVIGFLIGGLIN